MEMLSELVTLIFNLLWFLSPYLGLILVVLFTALILLAARLIGRRRQISPYSRQLITAFIVMVGVFAGILVLPVKESTRGQILSLLGILVSAVIALSSTNLMGNAMAGIMLRLSRTFRPGDFIEVEQTRGRVFEQGLFTTKIQIITRDVISLPNLYLIKQSLRVLNKEGNFISAPVSLGYDCSRNRVERLLLEAADSCGLKDCFVYVEDLLDHAVVYRVYGFLEDYTRVLTAKSDLKKAMLDTLHGDGVEIVSPGFVYRRQLPEDYKLIPPREEAPSEKGSHSSAKTKEETIEEKTFDKAEEAADLQELKEQYQDLQKQVEQWKEKRKELSGAEDKSAMAEKINGAKEKLSRMDLAIEAKQKEQGDRK